MNQTSKPLTLEARKKQRLNLLLKLEKAAWRDPELKPIEKSLRQLYCADAELVRTYELADAERKDKGEVLWEVFHPRTKTPLSCSMFDLPRQSTRTPRRRLVRNQFVGLKNEWELTDEDPWQQLGRELRFQPFDLEAFRGYARDIDELLRRDARRRNFVATDDGGRVYEVRAENEAEVRRRVAQRFGFDYVVSVKEAE